MTVTEASAPPSRGPLVIGLTPDEFIGWLTGKLTHATTAAGIRVRLAPAWQPGQHIALIGRTREGKTNLFVWIAATRKWVLALDPKGEDDSLEAAGYPRVTCLPDPEASWLRRRRASEQFRRLRVWERIDLGEPVRLVVGGAARSLAQDAALQRLMREALDFARYSAGWTVYVDEYQILADQRMYRLGPNVERMLISAARDGTSIITAFQAPAWVPKASTRQATIIICWKTRDEDMVKAVARAAGRPWREIAAALDELEKYWVLVIPDDLRAPMMCVKPPKVT